jgi:hypothetical protein
MKISKMSPGWAGISPRVISCSYSAQGVARESSATESGKRNARSRVSMSMGLPLLHSSSSTCRVERPAPAAARLRRA